MGFDVNYFDVEAIRSTVAEAHKIATDYQALQEAKDAEVKALSTTIKGDENTSFWRKLVALGAVRYEAMREVRAFREENVDTLPDLDWDSNFYDIIDRTFSIMNQHNSRLMVELCKPDILVQMPFDAYGEMSDYALAKEIIEKGRELMSKALDEYESKRRKIWGIF